MKKYGSIQTQFWSDLTLQHLSSPSNLLAVQRIRPLLLSQAQEQIAQQRLNDTEKESV